MPIIVNDIEITDDEVHAEMQYHPASSVEAARHKAARALVIRQLLLQEAKAKKILDAPEKVEVEQAEKTIDALVQQEVAVPRADRQSCKRYYERNSERFVDKRTHRLLPFETVSSHIRDYLYARSLRTGIGQYIELLAGRARIAGFDLYESDGPPAR